MTSRSRHGTPTRPRALAAELGERAHAASVADAVAAAEVVLVAVIMDLRSLGFMAKFTHDTALT